VGKCLDEVLGLSINLSDSRITVPICLAKSVPNPIERARPSSISDFSNESEICTATHDDELLLSSNNRRIGCSSPSLNRSVEAGELEVSRLNRPDSLMTSPLKNRTRTLNRPFSEIATGITMSAGELTAISIYDFK